MMEMRGETGSEKQIADLFNSNSLNPSFRSVFSDLLGCSRPSTAATSRTSTAATSQPSTADSSRKVAANFADDPRRRLSATA